MIKIYILTLKEAEKITEEYCKKYFPQRFERAEKFKFKEDKLRCIAAGYLLYEILGLEDEDIKHNEYGKPYSDKAQRQFCLSHSGNYIVLAVTDTIVGVDIEKRGRNTEDVAKKIFTAYEYSWYEQDHDKNFTRLWSLKESVSKAIGKGLALQYDSYNVIPLVNCHSIEVEGHILYGRSMSIDDYELSVCSEEDSDMDIEYLTIDKEHINE